METQEKNAIKASDSKGYKIIFETETGKEVNCSLYDYELQPA